MNHKTLFGIASIIFSLSCLIWSIGQATAVPQGPNISFAGNPYDNFYGNTNSLVTISVQNTSHDFMIEAVMASNYACDVKIDGTSVYPASSDSYNPFLYYNYNRSRSAFQNGTAKIKLPAGSSLSVQNCGSYFISGYYVQP